MNVDRRTRRIQELSWLAAAAELSHRRANGGISASEYRQSVLELHEEGCPVLVLADGLHRARSGVYEVLATARRHRESAAA
ncbi:hypothetical protein KIN34_14405 [Cellulomonas sp. DKR-3]|uniref:Transcriptional regulator n=1 Tax=Cellulomonas fulva TaxID=2835530 RepID=A0ABS5U256_9CELL|nr:hypothetical protein [Cellulomonas fulva]MBT0995475.1 hypothetical protein [Cellulomonas fulva]